MYVATPRWMIRSRRPVRGHKSANSAAAHRDSCSPPCRHRDLEGETIQARFQVASTAPPQPESKVISEAGWSGQGVPCRAWDQPSRPG